MVDYCYDCGGRGRLLSGLFVTGTVEESNNNESINVVFNGHQVTIAASQHNAQ